MSENNITTYIDSIDGTVYLRTQHGASAEEIAVALRPYVNRFMTMYLPNLYGYYRRYWGTLLSVNGVVATVHVPNHDYTTEINVFDAFGTHCTTIEPAKER